MIRLVHLAGYYSGLVSCCYRCHNWIASMIGTIHLGKPGLAYQEDACSNASWVFNTLWVSTGMLEFDAGSALLTGHTSMGEIIYAAVPSWFFSLWRCGWTFRGGTTLVYGGADFCWYMEPERWLHRHAAAWRC
eukprot:TRINITY_DN37020_c0_g2_i1.p1 TRINITY_DN37020_c0_g2~~TRINITY_DN37020_c0_g2_i1.p1  ORF type:complete len:133 (-),score=4.72 TRINITY_DN37020_c0_g2_i1:29-427(-)